MTVKFKNKIVISTTNLKSQSLKRLANELSDSLGYRVYRVLPDRVRGRRAVSFPSGISKDRQFRSFSQSGVTCPKFSFGGPGVIDALGDPKRIVCRALLNSSSGKGITIVERGQELPNVPLYTEYIPKKKEFRVHVYNNRVIDYAEKRKRRDHQDQRDTQIRNLQNGYVFCRDGITLPDGILDLALSAVKAIDRTQGAVDIIWNEKQNKCFVLEVNSNPGMEGTTLKKYVSAIKEHFNV